MICSLDDCEGTAARRGWCWKHYGRWQRHGDPLAVSRSYLGWPANLLERRVAQPNGCMYFTGAVNSSGYGVVDRDGDLVLVHRAIYELRVGPIPEGHELDHECHNADLTCPGGTSCPHRRCTNEHHLVPKRGGQNRRASRARERRAMAAA